jgi:(p)ppGpp synthase/HD superfamily hydrolase
MTRGDEQSLFSIALQIAIRAHEGQLDRAGEPYITHPLRMASRTQDPDERIVAILHDTVEDGLENGVTMRTLEESGIPERIRTAVDHLTRRKRDIFPELETDETYEAFVERSAADPLARRVKLLDLADNMDITRLPEVRESDVERLNRYLRAWRKLRSIEP